MIICVFTYLDVRTKIVLVSVRQDEIGMSVWIVMSYIGIIIGWKYLYRKPGKNHFKNTDKFSKYIFTKYPCTHTNKNSFEIRFSFTQEFYDYKNRKLIFLPFSLTCFLIEAMSFTYISLPVIYAR